MQLAQYILFKFLLISFFFLNTLDTFHVVGIKLSLISCYLGSSLCFFCYLGECLRHRWTGRYEAHLWDNSCRREGQSRKGRQGICMHVSDSSLVQETCRSKFYMCILGPLTLFPLSCNFFSWWCMHWCYFISLLRCVNCYTKFSDSLSFESMLN